MVTLPDQTRTAYFRSFGLVLSVAAGAVMAGALAMVVSPLWSFWGILLAFTMSVPALLQPQMVSLPYRVWNRTAQSFASGARFLLTTIVFYTILLAAGRAGHTMKLTRPSSLQSGWHPRKTLDPSAYLSLDDVSRERPYGKGLMSSYLPWALQSKNLWAVSLLPFLILLSSLDVDEPETVPSDIYTLF